MCYKLLNTCRGFKSSLVFSNYQNPWVPYWEISLDISLSSTLLTTLSLFNFFLSFSSICQYYSESSTSISFILLLVEEIWLPRVKTNSYLCAFVLTSFTCHRDCTLLPFILSISPFFKAPSLLLTNILISPLSKQNFMFFSLFPCY